jgi:hypothetical protein
MGAPRLGPLFGYRQREGPRLGSYLAALVLVTAGLAAASGTPIPLQNTSQANGMPAGGAIVVARQAYAPILHGYVKVCLPLLGR